MKDLSGRTFHCLTVREFTHVDGSGHAIWRCECSCGKSAPASSQALLGGRKKSCGHLRQEYLNRFKLGSPKKSRAVRAEFGTALDEGLDELEAMG